MSVDINEYSRKLAAQWPAYGPVLRFALEHLGRGESPLEELFLILWAYNHSHIADPAIVGAITYNGERLPGYEAPPLTMPRVDLQRQVMVGKKRVDFMATATIAKCRPVRFAIECDGHAFHDRTPAQASADRARDRSLLREGVITMRFTYADLTKRPRDCIVDFWDTLRSFTLWVRKQGQADD